jgi:hypothetical protein
LIQKADASSSCARHSHLTGSARADCPATRWGPEPQRDQTIASRSMVAVLPAKPAVFPVFS